MLICTQMLPHEFAFLSTPILLSMPPPELPLEVMRVWYFFSVFSIPFNHRWSLGLVLSGADGARNGVGVPGASLESTRFCLAVRSIEEAIAKRPEQYDKIKKSKIEAGGPDQSAIFEKCTDLLPLCVGSTQRKPM
jgi:hypothetical protein